jgi:titin
MTRIPIPDRPCARRRALVEPLESRQMLSATFAHAGEVAMAYDASGALHVAYYDTAARSLKYAQCSAAGVWSPTTTVDAGPQVGSSLAIAVDSSGDTGIAYYDAKKADLKYASFNGSFWSVTRVDTAGNVGQNPSLAFDRANHPLISYFSASGGDLKLAEFDGVHWTKTIIDRKGTAGQFSSIAINPVDGSWAIAYDETTKRQVRLATEAGERLTLVALGKAKAWTTDPSLAFTSGGAPGVSFFDPAAQSLKLTSFAGTFSTHTVEMGKIGAAVSLSFDPLSGAPQIAYADRGSGAIELATGSGGAWSTVTLGLGNAVSVARDPNTNGFSALTNSGSNASIGSALSDPTNLTAAVISNSEIDLAWTDNSTIETGFVIERSSDGGASFAPLAQVSANVTAYADTTAGDGVSYVYRVKAVDMTSSSQWDASNAVTTTLNAPFNLQAVSNADGTVHLSWQESSAGTTGFRVEISPDGIGFASIGLTSASVQQFDDLGASVNQTWYYRVIPFNAAGDGPATAALLVHTAVLSDPANLAATVVSNSEVDLQWTDSSTVQTGFVIERSTDGGASFSPLTQVSENWNTYADTSVGDGLSYVYRVKAVDGASNSNWDASNAVMTALNAPFNLQAVSNPDGTVHLTWQDSSAGTMGFRVEISPDGVGFASRGLTSASVQQFDDSGAHVDQTFYYRIVPFNAPGDGPATAALLVHTAPAAPAGLRVFAEGTSEFELIWSSLSGSATQVLVQSRLAGTSNAFQTLDTLTADQASDIVMLGPDGNPLAPNTAYEYRLVAENADGTLSADSNHAIGSTGLIVPENLSAQTYSATSIGLTWDANSGAATHYNVYLSTDGVNYTLYSPTYQQASTELLPDLQAATHYWFKVTAADGTNESAGVVVQADTLAGTPGAAPTNVSAQISEDNPLYLNISWTNVASDAIGFHIQRSADGINFTTIEDVPATWATYDDPSVVEGTYYYRVQTFSASGDGGISAVASATAFLAPPVNLQATVTTTGTVNLTWTNVSKLATGLQLFAADANFNTILLDGSVDPNATSYSVTQFADGTLLKPGTAYWFYLMPTGDIPSFEPSQWARVVNGFAAPPEVDVTATGNGQLTINWTDVGDETGYQIESSSDGVHYNFVATVGPNVTTYTQSGLPETATLYYRVMALGSGGNSSNTTSARTAVSPNAPTNLVVTPLAGGSFQLTWDDNSSNEDGYAVSFATANGETLIPAQLPANATSCIVTEAELSGLGLPGQQFTVKVVAFRWQGALSTAAEVVGVQALREAHSL